MAQKPRTRNLNPELNTNAEPGNLETRTVRVSYFQVTSIPKKCANTSRAGVFFGFCCGLRM